MNDLYLTTVTLDGLHFKRAGNGGGYAAPLPFEPEEGAYGDTFDAETLILTYLIPQPDVDDTPQDPVEAEVVITAEQLEAGKVFVITPKPDPVPASITRRQFFLELDALGVETLMDSFVAQSPRAVQIEYANAATFDREWGALTASIPLLDQFDPDHTWDDEFVNILFINAAKR